MGSRSMEETSSAIVCIASCVVPVSDTHTMRYVDALLEAGFRIVTATPGQPQHSLGPHWEHIELPTLSHQFFQDAGQLNAFRALGARRRSARRLRRILARVRPDAYLVSEPDAWSAAVKSKDRFGGIVVVDLREVYEDRASAFGLMRPVVRAAVRMMSRRLSKSTDEIIHVSEARRAAYDYLDKPGTVIGPYPFLASFPPPTDRPVSDGIVLIHAGALRSNYASNELIQAMDLSTRAAFNIKLVVFGGVRGQLVQQPLLERLQQRGVIDTRPPAPLGTIVAEMERGDIGLSLVLPIDRTHTLAQPRKLFEYLAAGLAVVAADVPTIRRIVSEYDCGVLVDPTSPESIAEGILRMVRDPDDRLRKARNARIAAERRFNWETEKARFQAIFLDLLPIARRDAAPT